LPEKTEKIWMDGKFVAWDEAKVHVLVSGLHYGSGVFEGIRCYKTIKGYAVFRLKEHIDRFFNSAKIYFLNIPYTREAIVEATKELIRVCGLRDYYIRPIAFKGVGNRGLDYRENPVHVAIAIWPWGAYLGEGARDKGIRCTFSSWVRIQNCMLPMMAKATGQYINSSLACIEARMKGFDEALMLDSRGFVSEGPGENLFLVKDGVLYTPTPGSSILLGVTRDSVMKLASDLGYKVVEKDILKEEVFLADELFFTGTAAEVTPIVEVDHRPVGDGKVGSVTRILSQRFFEVISTADGRYSSWFDFV